MTLAFCETGCAGVTKSVQEVRKPFWRGNRGTSPTCRQPNAPDTVKRCGVVRSARNANPAGYPRTPQDAPERGALMWQLTMQVQS
jgi:hypothetical protein